MQVQGQIKGNGRKAMLEFIKDLVWGIPTVVILTLFGIYFTIKSRFFQLAGISDVFSTAIKDIKKSAGGGISAAMALSTALGGTVGIGSITGVALAISEGGAGSVFWMWVVGFLGCMLKYAEINVAVKNRQKTDGIFTGGAMYALNAMGKKKTAVFFSLMCISASFCTGCLTQSSAVTASLIPGGMPRAVCGIFISLAVLLSVAGGRRLIARISYALMPAAGFIYILLTLYIIITRVKFLPNAFGEIFRSAFGIKQAGAGIMGYFFSQAVRVGFTRGIFSSEAGMGSSPIVHSSSENATPHTQGKWGIIEMYADIFVFSTLTALALLMAGFDDVGVMYFKFFGDPGRVILPLLLSVFGFASIISWCFYAESCIKFLFSGKSRTVSVIYRISVSILSFLGAVAAAKAVWSVADIFNALMIYPNLYLLFIKRKEICSCFGTVRQ